jgi:hypothetical protein
MSFKDRGYLIVKKFLDRDYYPYTCDYTDKNIGEFTDQTPNSPAFYGKPEIFKKLHCSIVKDNMELVTNLKLYPTYFYWRMYYEDAILIKHKDRPACEISVTVFIGGDPWDVWIKDYKGEEVCVKQEPGDALIYRGCDLEHWREPWKNQIDKQHAQIFFHYVDANGPNSWAKHDQIKEKP